MSAIVRPFVLGGRYLPNLTFCPGVHCSQLQPQRQLLRLIVSCIWNCPAAESTNSPKWSKSNSWNYQQMYRGSGPAWETCHFKTIFRGYKNKKYAILSIRQKGPVDEKLLVKFFDIEALNQDFARPVEKLKELYNEQLGLRTDLNALCSIKVKFDGKTYLIQDVAEIGKRGHREIFLDMSAFPHIIPSVMESLRTSPLNLNPCQSNTLIYLKLPQVTTEHRQKLLRSAKMLLDDCKLQLRMTRRKYMEQMEGRTELSKDDLERVMSNVDKVFRVRSTEAHEIYHKKEKDLQSENATL